jgi:hypothetical protein
VGAAAGFAAFGGVFARQNTSALALNFYLAQKKKPPGCYSLIGRFRVAV